MSGGPSPAHHVGASQFRNPWPSFVDKMTPSRVARMIWQSRSMWWAKAVRVQSTKPCMAAIWQMCAAGAAIGLRALQRQAMAPVQAEERRTPTVQATWVGHSTFLVHMAGLTLLTDPVFSDYASPVPYVGPKRALPPALTVEDIPRVDAVLVSHDHYDHLDRESVKSIVARFPDAHWMVPLGVGAWMASVGGVARTRIHEMDWWQSMTLGVTTDGSLDVAAAIEDCAATAARRTVPIAPPSKHTPRPVARFVCTPAQHNAGRGSQRARDTLWASWAVVEEQQEGDDPGAGHVVDSSEDGSRDGTARRASGAARADGSGDGTAHASGATRADGSGTTSVGGASAEAAAFFFAGDTGYRTVPEEVDDDDVGARDALPHCPAFAEVGQRYGPFTLAALPIGAYRPRWFMSAIHCDPDDAVCMHRDLRARYSVAMHWGGFPLTYEPLDEPQGELAKALRRRGVSGDAFRAEPVGQTFAVVDGEWYSLPGGHEGTAAKRQN